MSLLPFPPSFAKHDCARRKFRIRVYAPTLDEIAVEVIESWRVRFCCRHCLKTFTEYPAFALPQKRFVKQDVLAKAQRSSTLRVAEFARIRAVRRPELSPVGTRNLAISATFVGNLGLEYVGP